MVRSRFEINIARVSLVAVTAYFTFGLIIPIFSVGFQFESAAQFWETLTSTSTLSALKVTWLQSTVSTLGSLFLGILGAVLLYKLKIKSALFDWLLSIPYTIPTVVAAFTWVLILSKTGPLGFLNINYSLIAVIAAHMALNTPLVTLSLHQAMSSCPMDEIESAQSLCPNGFSVLLRYWLPRLRSSLIFVASQVFSLCATSFIIVMVLGGGPPIETLETGIFTRIRFGDPQWSGAAALALWQLILCVGPALLIFRKYRPRRLESLRAQHQIKKPASLTALLILSPFILIYLLPYFSKSFLQLKFLNPELLHVFWLSLMDSIAVALVSCSFAGLASLLIYASALKYNQAHKVLILLAQIPSGISTLILCLGVWFSYGSWIDPFEGRVLMIGMIQSILMMPFIIRSLSSSIYGTQLQSIEEARSLGASFLFSVRTILWPQFRRTVLYVFTVSAGVSFSEIAAVSFFSAENFTPLPLLMSRFMSQYRFAEAELIGLSLLAIAVFISSLQFWIGKRA
jgi:thiamine transport system permease protein